MISAQCSLDLSDDELARWHDDDLNPARIALIRTHIGACAACRERLAALNAIGAGLRGLEPPPLDLARLLEDLRDTIPSAAPSSMPTPVRLPTSSPRRSRRMVTGAAGLAAVLVISLLAVYIFTTHGRPLLTTPRQATPTIIPGSQTQLTAIGMSSVTDGWAMGQTYSNGNAGDVPVDVLHYTDGQWKSVKTAVVGEIKVIRMFSAMDGWAIGDRIYHYNGVAWRQVTVPGEYGSYSTLSAVSPTEIWIASDSPFPRDGRALILHYDGQSWTRQLAPKVEGTDSFAVNDLSLVSVTEGWAAGYGMRSDVGSYPPTGAILHYHNGVWQLAKTLPGYNLHSISMGSATDGWVGGSLETLVATGQIDVSQHPPQPIKVLVDNPRLWHYSNGAWNPAPLPGTTQPDYEGSISGITMFSATTGWLTGNPDQVTSSLQLGANLYHLEQGRWVHVPTKEISNRRYVTISQFSFLSPDDFWAVGQSIWLTGIPPNSTPGASVPTVSASHDGGYMPTVTPLIAHYHNGVWDIIES
jgi:hypothetical protein